MKSGRSATGFRIDDCRPGDSHVAVVRRWTSTSGDESSTEALVDLYDAWDQPEKAADYRALLREAERADEASQ